MSNFVAVKLNNMETGIFLGIVGPWQVVIILLVVLLLFGGKKIPELMKGLGKGIKDFKDEMNSKEDETPKKE